MPETRGSVRQRKAAQQKQPIPGSELPPYNARVEELPTSDEEDEEEVAGSEQEPETPKKKSKKQVIEDEDAYSPWVDVLRVITLLFVLSCGLSYLISGGESFFWGMKHPPKYMQAQWWQAQFRGPIYLTLDELAKYDGQDPELPLYLALNGTIYDVSANYRMYGPGGSYRFFSGTDAARGFVTGCFAEDRTADMRGVEEMFLPLDDAEADAQLGLSDAEMADLRVKELEAAQKKVHDGLAHWMNFFGNSQKYQKVGYVKREEDWLEKEPRRELCDAAKKGRKKRKAAKKN